MHCQLLQTVQGEHLSLYVLSQSPDTLVLFYELHLVGFTGACFHGADLFRIVTDVSCLQDVEDALGADISR